MHANLYAQAMRNQVENCQLFLSVPAWVGVGLGMPICFGIMDKLKNQDMARKT
jgi:hypothetical protein